MRAAQFGASPGIVELRAESRSNHQDHKEKSENTKYASVNECFPVVSRFFVFLCDSSALRFFRVADRTRMTQFLRHVGCEVERIEEQLVGG